tara:strand:+ start:541 stop:1392 length:852 start_codon:yes stop_codon:yes gene_type:complete
MAYKQTPGRDNLKNSNISTLTSGGVDTDPNKKKKKKKTNDQESRDRIRQIKEGKAQEGEKNYLDPSYSTDNANITRTTRDVTKNNTSGGTYNVTEDVFQNKLGGDASTVTQGNGNISIGFGEQYYNNSDDRASVKRSAAQQANNPTIPGTSSGRGRGRQNYATEVTGGGDSDQPLRKYGVNVKTGDRIGQTYGPRVGNDRKGATGFYEGGTGKSNTPQMDGTERYINVTKGMNREDIRKFVRQDSLGALDTRRREGSFIEALNFKNKKFAEKAKIDLTKGSKR